MANTLKLESSTENAFVKWVTGEGYNAIKLNKVGWPDRLVVLENGYCFYIEFKRCVKTSGLRQGEKYQNYIHKKLRLRGFHVYLLDSIKEAKKVLNYELSHAHMLETSFKELIL